MKTASVLYSKLKKHDDWRWDSEFLCDEPYHNTKLIYKPIGDILTLSQYGLSIDMNEDGYGCKIYRMNEISDMFCDREINKYAKITPGQINKFKLKDNDVLFNRTNSLDFVGRTGIFKKFSEESLVFASYLIRVRTNENEVLPEYLTTFLNTKYGIQDAKRRARISINQSNINAEELKRIEIPILSKQMQETIRDLLNSSFNLINKSESSYRDAEQILLSELGLLNWKSKHRIYFIKNFSDTQKAERIDAEYFQPMYEEIINAVRQYHYGFDSTSALLAQNKSGFKKKPDELYQYVEISSVNTSSGEIEPLSLVGKELPANAKIKLKNGNLIISKVRTYRGAVAIVQHDGFLGSGAFTVLSESEKMNKETAYVYFKSAPILKLSLKYNAGTTYPVIDDKDILNIPFPLIPEKIQQNIKQKITEMYNARALSKYLLDTAKRGVEMAIEKSEKDAQSWIETQLKKLNAPAQ